MSGLSLWLSPPPSSNLATVITSLAAANSTVPFAPHATLVSDKIVPSIPVPDIVARLKAVAESPEWSHAGAPGLELRFQDVRQGPSFYQCVLVALFPDPSLLSLHDAILTAFDMPIPSPTTYFPHLSLVYADLSPAQKAAIIDGLHASGEVSLLPDGKGTAVRGENAFLATEILLVRTAGPPPEWEVLARVPFGKAAEGVLTAAPGFTMLGGTGATCAGDACEF